MSGTAKISSRVDEAGSLRLRLEAGGDHAETYFASSDARLAPANEAWVAAAFLPAMRLGLDLEVQGELSRRFNEGLEILGGIYTTWWPGQLRRIAVRGARPATRSPRTGGRVGLFFTAGIDSFYSFLQHQDEITDLIFVSGFGTGGMDTPTERRRLEMVRRAAAGLGRNLIIVRSDIHDFLTGYGLSWVLMAAGPALTTVGLLLQDEFSRIYVAASDTYDQLMPWSSHPLTDPRWSTETLEFVHDGCEASRLEKARRIATSAVALQTLRVCEQPSAGAPNCGRCDKCVRTMLRLAAAGALEKCATFDVGLDASHGRNFPFKQGRYLDNYLESLKLLEASGQYADFVAAFHGALVRWRRAGALKSFIKEWFPGAVSARRWIRRALGIASRR